MSRKKQTGPTPVLPPAVPRSYSPFQIQDTGTWLLLSDLHLPYHEPKAIETALAEGIRRKVRGVLLNGDVLDYHELSSFDHDPSAPRYLDERQVGTQFLAYLRHKFPKARIIYKSGNHEERLERYLMKHAPALFGLDLLTLGATLDLPNYGIEHVGDKRVIRLGHLNVLHGHEYRPTIQTPVNPARGLFLRSKGTTLAGHFHQTSEHHEPTITGKSQGCWSTGCLCQLSPVYMPLNKWCHGFAVVEIMKGGQFSVDNLRILDGVVV